MQYKHPLSWGPGSVVFGMTRRTYRMRMFQALPIPINNPSKGTVVSNLCPRLIKCLCWGSSREWRWSHPYHFSILANLPVQSDRTLHVLYIIITVGLHVLNVVLCMWTPYSYRSSGDEIPYKQIVRGISSCEYVRFCWRAQIKTARLLIA